MARRVSAVYRSRALAEAALARVVAAGLADARVEKAPVAEAQSGMFDRLATILASPDTSRDADFLVSMDVSKEQIDAAALALEAGAERVEIAPPPRLEGHVVEISETADVLVVEKQAVVREEIVMRVQATERLHDIHDTVRRMDVDVERFGPTDDEASPTAPR